MALSSSRNSTTFETNIASASMETIRLGTTEHTTTRVGFGCAHLVGTLTWRESSNILDAAYDAGIRHFDVAAMYGFGEAERCLGQFVHRRRGSGITITTKFGIPGGKKRRLFRLARFFARPLMRRLRENADTRTSPTRLVEAPAAMPPPDPSRFDVDRAAVSLDASLKALKTDHIHIFLLHEAIAAELIDDRLLRFLQDAVQSGKIGMFGVGSDLSKIPALIEQKKQYCPVTQYQWCAADPVIPSTSWFRIHHGMFGPRIRALQALLQSDTRMATVWSEQVGHDMTDSAQVMRLAFRASLVMNPDSMVLFATNSPKHVLANCEAGNDESLALPARLFAKMVRSHYSVDRTKTVTN